MMYFWHSYVILITLLSVLHVMSSSVYLVVPDDHPSIGNDTHTINEYLNNTVKYFTSNTELHFLPGYHYLQRDFIIQNVTNFMISGTADSTIVCNSIVPVGIAIINVTGFIFQNISVINCAKDYKSELIGTFYFHNHSYTPLVDWIQAAVYLYSCSFTFINTLSIISNFDINGILLVNMKAIIKNLIVKVNKFNIQKNVTTYDNGILVYYYDDASYDNLNGSVDIQNFTYKYHCDGCYHSIVSQNALSVILTQLHYNVTVTVTDSTFYGLFNTGIFYYYGESCGVDISNHVLFNNCKIYNNLGNQRKEMHLFIMMFHNAAHMFSSIVNKRKCDQHYNIIEFNNCILSNNSNIISVLYLIPINTVTSNVKLIVKNCSFHQNHAVHLITSISEVQMLWQLSHDIVISDSNFISNTHRNGFNVISVRNGLLKLADTVRIINNSYFYDILDLYLSILKLSGTLIISGNLARHIAVERKGSYYLVKPNTTVKVANNTVVTVVSYAEVHTSSKQLGEMCRIQFLNNGHNLDDSVARNETLPYRIEIINNTFGAPMHLVNSVFGKCTWLPNTAFQDAESSVVFSRILNVTNMLSIDREKIEVLPTSVCECKTSSKHDCTSHYLGSTYPGKTLTVNLIVPGLMHASKSSIQIVAEVQNGNAPDAQCTIIEATEINQVRFDHGCNEYNYTVWSEKSECELYLAENDLSGTDIFYISLLPCPIGFTIQSNVRACSCDPLLNKFVASCNLNDGTIQRTANSWISGKTVNGSHTYDVSSNCPFDYCLPYSSYLNISVPDQQCQFQRSGVLCGHCPEGLSTVFGSSQCQKCSNVYLFVVIPIALSGILLVLMLFMLNLTVTNGTLNTFVFYFNIVSINMSMFIPTCHDSIACVTLSLFNLDLGIKTCLYDGMDDYAKTWLQLAFPVYLIFIALVLIVGSRHSKLIQRLTARRGLPVLATLFLLSYTKVLLMICHAIFYYSTVTHLPGKHSTLVWSVDTNIPLFGIKFSILFVICLFLFLILLPFNMLLLFTRLLMRFNFISTFKPLLDAYFGPYKDKFYYWTGLQLILRAIFLALSTCENDVNLTGGIILLGILLCVQGVVHPFKSQFKNVQESVILLDLQALYVTVLYNDNNKKQEIPIAWFLLFTVLAYFIILICYHCIMSMCGGTIKRRGNNIISTLKSKFANTKVSHESTDMETLRSKIPDVTLNYKEFQEPLIALSD